MVLRNKLLEKRGLNIIHPWCAFLYLLMALILTMCTMNPFLIMTSLITGIIYEIHTIGFKKFSRYILGLVLIVVITTIGNMCISHNGANVLFIVNDNRITVESAVFGVVFGTMFAAAFLWCDIMQRIITGEKITFMFGSFAPNLGLVISMTLHYIPLLRKRLQVVRNAQAGMGRNNYSGIFKKIRQRGKEFSIVIAWSLENSIETSNIMTSMGYGIGKRTNYSNYRIKRLDILFLVVIIALAVPSFIVTLSVSYKVYYYPTFGMMCDIRDIAVFWICYLLYMLVPILAERVIKWH